MNEFLTQIYALPSSPWFSYLWPVAISILTVILSNKFYPSLHKPERKFKLQQTVPQLLLTVPSALNLSETRCFFAELFIPVQTNSEVQQNAYYNFTEFKSSPHNEEANLIVLRIKNDSDKGISLTTFFDPKNGNISIDSFVNRCLDRTEEIRIVFLSKDLPSKVYFKCDEITFFYAIETDTVKTTVGSYITASISK